MERAEPAKPGRYPFAPVKAAKNCWKHSCQEVPVLPGSTKADGCPGCREGAELRCGRGKLVFYTITSSLGPWFWEEKLGIPLEVCHFCLPLSSGRVFGSAPVCFFPMVNTFLWVRHFLPLYPFDIKIVVIIRPVLFHCFLLSVKCYLNP